LNFVSLSAFLDKHIVTMLYEDMKRIRNNLQVLTAQKAQTEARRISLRTVSDETGLTRHTIYGIAQNTLKEYPRDAIEKLCTYFSCEIGDLFSVVEVEE
jgi:putative transcriptional regulator